MCICMSSRIFSTYCYLIRSVVINKRHSISIFRKYISKYIFFLFVSTDNFKMAALIGEFMICVITMKLYESVITKDS